MRRNLPPLNALLAFDAAARHDNFTRAARELSVAQPAVTRHIHNLEEWLGTDLFKRKGNAVELSSDGYALSELITPLFDRLELGLGQFSATRENEITIGASFGMMHLWLMPQITAMRDAAQGANINFVTTEHYSEFENANIDFSIRFGSGDWPNKQADLIFSENTCVIASPDFLKQNPSINPEQLAQSLKPEWLLEHGDPFGYGWMTWEKWFHHHNAEHPVVENQRYIPNYPTVLDMVRCGEGVALGYNGLDNHLVESGEIVRLGPPLNRPDFGYFLLSEKSRRLDKKKEEFRNYLLGRN